MLTESEKIQSSAGIILCGGKSRRMGRSKATLPFGAETLLQRTVLVLEPVVSPLVIVAHEGQELPVLPDQVIIVHDEIPDLGPLGGLLTGLKAIREINPAVPNAFLSSCDAPFLKPEFVTGMLELAEGFEIAIPRDENYFHTLSAVYQVDLIDSVQEMINRENLKPFNLFEKSRTNEISMDQIRQFDPELDSLVNVNTEEEYQAALKKAGL